MATKNKKIETRLDPDTYAALEELAEQYGTSIYNMVQICINLRLAGIKKNSKATGYKFVSCAVSDENFEKLTIAANELNVNMPSLVWSSIQFTMKKNCPQIDLD